MHENPTNYRNSFFKFNFQNYDHFEKAVIANCYPLTVLAVTRYKENNEIFVP